MFRGSFVVSVILSVPYDNFVISFEIKGVRVDRECFRARRNFVFPRRVQTSLTFDGQSFSGFRSGFTFCAKKLKFPPAGHDVIRLFPSVDEWERKWKWNTEVTDVEYGGDMLIAYPTSIDLVSKPPERCA